MIAQTVAMLVGAAGVVVGGLVLVAWLAEGDEARTCERCGLEMDGVGGVCATCERAIDWGFVRCEWRARREWEDRKAWRVAMVRAVCAALVMAAGCLWVASYW